jgi:hypothetical protein
MRGSLILLYQEKACDHINWSYLHKCIDTFGFDPRWQAWIRRLYRELSASFMVNVCPMMPVRITQDLHQGDSLSPLLYNLVLEPLLAFLRMHLVGLAFLACCG